MFGFGKKEPVFQPTYTFAFPPKVTCQVCGCKFMAVKEHHYVSRDNSTVGFTAAFGSTTEETCYDTFDCPQCGSQCVVQERKRHKEKKS